MSFPLSQHRFQPRMAGLFALLASPAIVIFVSTNFVNLGNLAFNMIFSRWMGPELFGDLALVLTIKLALLGVLGALQMAVSRQVAGSQRAEGVTTEQVLSRINRVVFVSLWLMMPVVGLIIVGGAVDARLGLNAPYLLLLLLVSVPFSAPLNILRGVALGQLRAGRIVVSANVEMAVRLVGGMLAWQMGLGVQGVVASVALSIVAGWAVLADILPSGSNKSIELKSPLKALSIAAVPFAVLQVGQVLALDGDVFLVKSLMDATEAGLVAALSLFQRIQFFAIFGLASVLLPSVVAASVNGTSLRAAILPVVVLWAAVAAVFLLSVAVAPELMVSLLVGPAFSAAAPMLELAVVSAVAFTASYLMATFLAALNDFRGIWIVATTAAIQIVLMGTIASSDTANLQHILQAKAACQVTLAAVLLIFTAFRLVRTNRVAPL